LKLNLNNDQNSHKKDYNTLEKKHNELRELHKTKEDECRKSKDEPQKKPKNELFVLKDKHAKFGDKFCDHELDLQTAKV
jgi:hypothetical protein